MEILNLNLTVDQALQGTINCLTMDSGLFYVALKKHAHHHLFRHLVKDPEKTYFTPKNDSFQYELIDTQVLDSNVPGISCYEFYLRFSLKGSLTEMDENGWDKITKPFQFKAIAKVHHFSSSYGIHHEDLSLLNEAQYRLLLDERELKSLRTQLGWSYLSDGLFDNQYTTTFFTAIWNKTRINSKDTQRTAQLAEHTSLNFHHELESAYASIIYAALQAKRLQPYLGSFRDDYRLYHGSIHYFVKHNIFLNRHHEFLSYALAAVYAFWERLAFLSALHLLPAKLKTISFFGLYHKQLADIRHQYPSIVQTPELAYLAGRCTNRHATLMKYRHPLTHYQHEEAVNRGNMNADHSRLMLNNINNEIELEHLYQRMQETMDFVEAEINECKLGYYHTVNLLKKVQEPI